MSIQEQIFIKRFGSIAAALVISFIISGVVMYRTVAVMSVNIETNHERVDNLERFHKSDILLIREDIDEIKESQKDMRKDIKEILKELK